MKIFRIYQKELINFNFLKIIKDPYQLMTILLILILISPIITIFFSSLSIDIFSWKHLISTKLYFYISNTLILLFGVGFLSLVIGLSTAWIIARYDFHFKTIIEWALLLPAAIPSYIIAYCYTDFLDYSGPIQTFLRDLFLFKSSSEYFFPEIRSMGGAIFVISFVLYPYIYFISKLAFTSTPISLYELAKLRGESIFFKVALPIARPAIIGALSLVFMETISDFGTVEFFAIETLTLGIFNLWLGMDDFVSATQLSFFCFFFIIALLCIELIARRQRRYNDTDIKNLHGFKIQLDLKKSFIPIFICLLPIIIGFAIPVSILITQSFNYFQLENYKVLFEISINTLIVAGLSSFLIILIGIFISISVNFKGNKFMHLIALISGSGYAFPGIILALGTSILLGFFQKFNLLNNFFFIGSLSALILAYLARFNAVGFNSINASLLRMPLNLVEASTTLNKSFEQTIFKIIIPLIKPGILIAGLLSFVDIAKELPITLLLRPFNFETLATFSYQYAKDEMFEQSALASLLIVCVGIIPIILLNFMIKNETFLHKKN